MASETNDDRYEAIGKQFDQFKSELRALDAEIAVRRMQIATVGQNENVEGALQIFDRVSKILADPTPRSEITEMVHQIGLRIGLTFVGVPYGKNRVLRQLESGIITFGDRELPVPLHGKYRLAKRDEASQCGPKDVIQSERNQLAREEVCDEPSSEMLGSARSEHNQSRHRNNSSTKAMSGSPRL